MAKPNIVWDDPPAPPGVVWDTPPAAPAPAPAATPPQQADALLNFLKPLAAGAGPIGSALLAPVSAATDVAARMFGPQTGGKPTSATDRLLASPEARFAKGLLVDPVVGTAQAIQSPLGHLAMPTLDPVGAASDLAGTLAPGNAFTTGIDKGRNAQNDMINTVNQRVVTARKNVNPADTGHDYAQTAGAIGSMFLPMPGGEANAVRDAMQGAAPLTGDALKAAQYVSGLARKAGQTPATIAAQGTENAGRGMLGAEALGNTGVAHLAALGRREGETSDALAGTLLARAQTSPNRILSDFATASGIDPNAALGIMDDVVRSGRAAAKPLYDKAFSGGSIEAFLPTLQDAYTAAGSRVQKLSEDLDSAQTGATLIASKHLPTDNVYGANSAIHAKAEADAAIAAAQSRLNAAMAERDQIAQQMRQAQQDAAAGVKGGMWSPHLQRMLNDPVSQQGINLGLATQRIEANAANEPFQPWEYANIGTDAEGNSIIKSVPNARLVDAAKRGLDQIINSSKDAYGRIQWNENLHAVNNLRLSLLKEADRLNPEYADARAAAADPLSAQDAFQRAQDMVLNPNVTVKQFTDHFNSLSPANQEAFRGGIANKLFNQSQNARLGATFLKSPAGKQKMVAALGQDAADTFLNNLGREGTLLKTGQRMMPASNSITSDIQNATREQDASLDPLQLGLSGLKAVGQLHVGDLLGAASHVGKIAKAAGAFQTAGMPVAVRNIAGQHLMQSPEELAAALQQWQAARVGANNLPGTLAPRAALGSAGLLTQFGR